MTDELVLGARDLVLDDVVRCAFGSPHVRLSPDALDRARQGADYVRAQAERDRVIYGVTTGFGANSQHVIPIERMHQLQSNLLLSHACGVGKPFPREVVRAALCVRVNSLLTVHSGAQPATIETLCALLDADLLPVVPSQGSVGASGDLCPLAHISLPLIGFGEVEDSEGNRLTGAEALARVDLQPIALTYKEGIALINGTQIQTALGVVACARMARLLEVADAACAMSLEAVCGRTDAWDDRIHRLRRHAGQRATAERLRAWVEGSELAGVDPALLDLVKVDAVQDPYSLRCAPQVHGAARGVLDHVASVVSNELNAVTDNPLLFPDDDDILSGGNFHGEPIAMALDYLKIAASELGNISDRRSFKLLTPTLNEGLPPFLVDTPGVNSGLMITQYVTAALVSENKVLAHPSSVDSIPTSANKEDLVAMGAQAGMQLASILDNVERVLSIELLIAAQALDMRERTTGRKAGPAVRALRDHIREHVPFVGEDRVFSGDIEAIRSRVLPEINAPC